MSGRVAGVRRICRAAAAALLLAVAPDAWAAELPSVDVALVLAVDASTSVDADESEAQRAGYAAALRHPDFFRAVASGRRRRVAVTYFEWARGVLRLSVVPWRIVGSRRDAAALAAAIEALPALQAQGTSISTALDAGVAAFSGLDAVAARRVIDLSGDGPNNLGGPVTAARDRAVRLGVTVSGLPVMIRPSPAAPALDRYFADCVAGGEGSFVLPVRAPGELADAIRRKLILEVSGAMLPVRLVAEAAPADCLAGERFRARWADPFFPELGP